MLGSGRGQQLMNDVTAPWHIGVDVGGTFTDVVLERGAAQVSTKVLTTQDAPERGVLEGVRAALERADAAPGDVGLVIHGTTLATNALIERKGARTALVVTEGFRDSVEMAHENRFEQYDISMDRPPPLVPRWLRWPVRERMSARGEPLIPLDEASVWEVAERARKHDVDAIAVGLLHSYANPEHEQRVGALLAKALPDVTVTLSCEVCPEIREYERLSTACANAYVQPRMARYLSALDEALKALGLSCPFMLMTSGGGLTDLETAVRFPVRLVESGPAGGAVLAAWIARQRGLDRVLSFDMGGTTAKLCLIDDCMPQTTRSFEVARAWRNLKGSGLPLRIPAIEMVEIGAGGGSIAAVDGLGRLRVGPESAGADPGPASYGRGGTAATVTDADLVLGRIDATAFAGGSGLDARSGAAALNGQVAGPLEMTGPLAAYAVSEVVDENMANAARVHAVEWGKDIRARTMIAFGGAAPLHAARLAEKLELDAVVVPPQAGVGSAVGFLRAPVSYELARSRHMRLSAFDTNDAVALLEEMASEARAVVALAAGEAANGLDEVRHLYMRYVGQGHEIAVRLPEGGLGDTDLLRHAFEAAYRRLYDRAIPGQDLEVLSWTVTVSSAPPEVLPTGAPGGDRTDTAANAPLFDNGSFVEAAMHRREALAAGASVPGPALIVEDQTTTVVSAAFDARVEADGSILLTRKDRDIGGTNP